MKKILALLFTCAVIAVIALGITTSIAQAEPFTCMYCYSPPPGQPCMLDNTACSCPGNPYQYTTCYLWCMGACAP